MAKQSDNEIKIVEVEINHDNAVLLLDAAQRLGHHPAVVETTSEGVFRVPADVAEASGVGSGKEPSESKVAKARENVVPEDPEPYGDPLDPEQPEREDGSNAVRTAQADAELAERQSETKSGRSSQTAKKATAKKATAKKAAAPKQKSE